MEVAINKQIDNLETSGWRRENSEYYSKCKSVYPVRPDTGVWNIVRFIAGPCKETGDWYPPNPEAPEGFQQSVFKGKGSCRFLGVAIPCSCSYTSRYGRHIPVNLQ